MQASRQQSPLFLLLPSSSRSSELCVCVCVCIYIIHMSNMRVYSSSFFERSFLLQQSASQPATSQSRQEMRCDVLRCAVLERIPTHSKTCQIFNFKTRAFIFYFFSQFVWAFKKETRRDEKRRKERMFIHAALSTTRRERRVPCFWKSKPFPSHYALLFLLLLLLLLCVCVCMLRTM